MRSFQDIAQKHSGLATFLEYGQSTGGSKLFALRIQDSSVTPSGKRPAALISEGIHGNEFLNITDRLPEEFLERSESTSGFKKFLAKGGVVIFVPVVNPDGFTGRMRENQAGKDLNRDWSLKAAGNSGFTQPETKSLSEFIANEVRQGNLSLEVSMEYHCCIGGLIHPWNYTRRNMEPKTMARLVEVGKRVQEIFGYRYGTVREIVGYEAAGGSDDYYLETYGRRAFSFEGAYRQEADKLAKHVEMWNSIFEFALADSKQSDSSQSENLFLAVSDDNPGAHLYVSTPSDFQNVRICPGRRKDCLSDSASARYEARFERQMGNRRIYNVSPNLTTIQSETLITVLASRSTNFDDQSASVSVIISKLGN